MSDSKSSLFMFKKCEKGYESPKKQHNSIKKIRSMSKTLDSNLNMNHRASSKDEYKIKNYEDDFKKTKHVDYKNYNTFNTLTDRNNIFQSNSINRVINPTTLKKSQAANSINSKKDYGDMFSNFNHYESITRPKISDSTRTKMTMISTEFSSPSKR